MTNGTDTDVPDYAQLLRLDTQTHVVLGAGQGIGRQIAHGLTSVGARVVCVDLVAERAKQVADEVGGLAWSGDVTERTANAELFSFVADNAPTLNGVVDIIGMSRYRRLTDLSDEDWSWHHDIVLRHAYLAISESWQLLKSAGGGSYTFVASIAGIGSSPMLAAYGAEKAALMSLVRSAAVELGPDGIRVNAIAPGIIRTPRAEANPAWTQELLDINIGNTPLRRLGRPADVAAALLFMVSPLAGHITGQTLVVDGGLTTAVGVVTPQPS